MGAHGGFGGLRVPGGDRSCDGAVLLDDLRRTWPGPYDGGHAHPHLVIPQRVVEAGDHVVAGVVDDGPVKAPVDVDELTPVLSPGALGLRAQQRLEMIGDGASSPDHRAYRVDLD